MKAGGGLRFHIKSEVADRDLTGVNRVNRKNSVLSVSSCFVSLSNSSRRKVLRFLA